MSENPVPAGPEPGAELVVRLKPGEEDRIVYGHQWAFSNEIDSVEGQASPGAPARLLSSDGRFLARGFYNAHSLIAFRALAFRDEPVDAARIEASIREADAHRRRFYPGAKHYRAVFGESDRLPGLVVDRYGDLLVVQVLAAGMEAMREEILGALRKVYKPKAVFARNDHPARGLEGLAQVDEVWLGDFPERTVVEEGGLEFEVALKGGQKTGWYFDQRDNRAVLAPYLEGRKVLDLHCYAGGFGLYAAKAGALRVLGADSSPLAVELANANARRNGLDSIARFEKAPAEQLLASMRGLDEEQRPDAVLLDPPSLAPNRKSAPKAKRAYVRLNRDALRGLGPGGLLATSTCSQHIRPETFREILAEAAGRARRRLRVLEWRGQSADHPSLIAMPETRYLNFALLEVLP